MPEPTHCGHSPSEIVSSEEGTSYCAACEREARTMPDPITMPACRCRTCRKLINTWYPGAGRDQWTREECRCADEAGVPTDDLDAAHYCARHDDVRRP